MTDLRTETPPHFSHPVRQIVLMLIALGLVGAGTFLALPKVLPVFAANPQLNGFIVLVFVIGVLSCFWQVLQLIRSVRWIEGFTGPTDQYGQTVPQLLAPLATLLGSRGAQMQLSATSSRSILDSVGTRIEEDREITRYIVNVLIFLGLLGTFYGLATTVPALVDTIRNLAPKDGEAGIEVFGRLITGLESQLSGMGVAFASSLLGLAGSLVVGLLELFASHGQNRFYRELEEWLSSITRLGLAAGEDGATDQEVMESILIRISEQVDALQRMADQSGAGQAEMDARMSELTGAIAVLGERMDSAESIAAMQRVTEGQERLIDKLAETDGGLDAESRMRLRSIDVQLLRLSEEIAAGRVETMADLGQMIRSTRGKGR